MPASLVDTALRTFSGDIAPLLKGVSLATVAPVILVALVGFLIFKIFFADSPALANPTYGNYARSIALTAADLWDRRNELGLSPNIRGRTLESLEPLTEVLDALANSVKKYESFTPNSIPGSEASSKIRFE